MPRPRTVVRRLLPAILALLAQATEVDAGPLVPVGDAALRHDIERLADVGILRGPVTTWPLAWGPIIRDLDRIEAAEALSPSLAMAAARVRRRALSATRAGELRYRAGLAAAEEPLRWRSFADTPRESGEVTAGFSWMGDWLSIELNGQAVGSPDDGEEFRADGSQVAAVVGNYAIAVGTLDRWWGPGRDGSLILSSNARPIPALTLDRLFTEPFESRWLRWIGPWDLSVIAGRMESDRAVPEAQFLGLRFAFRPLRSLEVGLSRSAQWCGDGRPCDLGTLGDLLLGRDNRGDEGIDGGNEPGNQLAGVDFRWSVSAFGRPGALYGQFVGEDEAGGLPSKFLGLAGAETSGTWRDHWSWRGFLEGASTKCRFYRADGDYDCAYNHGIYQTGYRYRRRAIGHGADNDALVISTGLSFADDQGTQWRLLARYGELNRGGAPDPRNGLTPAEQELASLDLVHARRFRFGVVEIGAGVERLGPDTDGRAFVQWHSSR